MIGTLQFCLPLLLLAEISSVLRIVASSPDRAPARGGLFFGRSLMSWFGRDSRPSPGAPPERIAQIPVDRIFQNPYQPRRAFQPAALEQLKRSIRQYGVLVPVVVRRVDRGWELACGERRLRACRELGLPTIPAVVRDMDTPQMLEIALCENLARAALSPLEEAETYERLRQEFVHLEPAVLNEKLGLSADTVARYQTLLRLPLVVKRALSAGLVTGDHALLLARVTDEARCLRLLSLTLERQWDARRLEQALADETIR